MKKKILVCTFLIFLILFCMNVSKAESDIVTQMIINHGNDNILTKKYEYTENDRENFRTIIGQQIENLEILLQSENLDGIDDEKLNGLDDEYRQNLYDNLYLYSNTFSDQTENNETFNNMLEKTRESLQGSNGYVPPTVGGITSSAENFIERGKEEGSRIFTSDDLKEPVVGIGQILVTVGIIVLLIAIAVMGIKYMVASPNEQANLKQQLIGLVVSAVVILGGYTIWQATVKILESI